MPKKSWLLSLFLLLGLLLAACGDATSIPVPATTAPAATTAITTTAVATSAPAPTTAPATTVAATTAPATTAATTASTGADSLTYPVTAPDGMGVDVTLAKFPERIVCLGESCLDALAELDLPPPVATPDLFYGAAISPRLFGDKAKSIIRLPNNGNSLDIEKLAQTKPDLIIGSSQYVTLRDGLKAIAPFYVMKDATNVATAIDELRELTKVLGRSTQAETAIKRLNDKLAAYKARSPHDVSMLIMANYAEGNQQFFSTSQSALCSMFNELVKCGFDAPAVFAGYAQVSLEAVLQADPQALFVISIPLAPKGSYDDALVAQQLQAKQSLATNSFWNNLNAVKNGRVYEVDRSDWYGTSGTRSLGFALDDVMTKLYPSIFPKAL
jgi:iron complex transport system substrate-binding protein